MISIQLQNSQPVIKKGWLHKKGSTAISRWKLKWAVLHESPFPSLYIYDRRDHTQPKYIIRLGNCDIKILEQLKWTDLLSSLENVKEAAFTISTRHRKFYFAAQNSNDRDEWINCLKQYTNLEINQLNFNTLTLNGGNVHSHYSEDYGKRSRLRSYSRAESVYSVYSMRTQKSDGARASSAASTATEAYPRSYAPTSLNLNRDIVALPSIRFLDESIKLKEVQNFVMENSSPNRIKKKSVINPNDAWDDLYQDQVERVLKSGPTALEESLKLCDIIGRFQEMAKSLSMDIIDKYHETSASEFEDDAYVVGNIFVQFVANYEEDSDEACQGLARKSGNELKALRYFNEFSSSIRTALLCLVDYKGFRTIVCPIMPITKNTLKPDLEIQDFTGAPVVMKKVHVTADTSALVPSSAEVHKSGRNYYVLNLNDLLPKDKQFGNNEDYRYRSELLVSYESAKAQKKFLNLSEYLESNCIPNFIEHLDNLEQLPLDSASLTSSMHEKGISIRYLGVIYEKSTLPHVKQMCLVEMIARVFKRLFREKMRKTIQRFKKVQAGNSIDQELISITVKMFNNVLSANQMRFWKEKIIPNVHSKFRCNIESSDLTSLHKPQLFLAMQYHCDVEFTDSMDYNFNDEEKPFNAADFVSFNASSKFPDPSISVSTMKNQDEVEIQAYKVSKGCLLNGPSHKFSRNCAGKFASLSRSLILSKRYSDAAVIADLAYRVAQKNHVISGLIRAAYVEATWLNKIENNESKGKAEISEFSECLHVARFHLNDSHPIQISFSDKITHLLTLKDSYQCALMFLEKSFQNAVHTLGPGHHIAAGYRTKIGYLLLSMHRAKEAIEMFQEALKVFEKVKPNDEAVAENHYILAEALFDEGNMESALRHSLKAIEIRESKFGTNNPKTVDSYQQYGKFISVGYSDYDGIITHEIRKHINSALTYYEKVFKFTRTDTNSVNQSERNDLLLILTRTIVQLKLKIVPSEYRDLLSRLKLEVTCCDNEVVKSVMLKLIQLSPSVFIDDIFYRLESDKMAKEELAVIIQISQNPAVRVAEE